MTTRYGGVSGDAETDMDATNLEFAPPSAKVGVEEQKAVLKEVGLEGAIPVDLEYTEEELALRIRDELASRERKAVRDAAPGYYGLAAPAVYVAAIAADPANAAACLVPGISVGGRAASSGLSLARGLFRRFLNGAANAAVSGAGAEAALHQTKQLMDKEYGLKDAAINVGAQAVAGGVLAGASGAVGDMAKTVTKNAAKALGKAAHTAKESTGPYKYLDRVRACKPGAELPRNPDSPGPGRIVIEQGANPNLNEQRAIATLEQYGYNGTFLKETAGKKGKLKDGGKTQDLYIDGLGRVEIYTPTTTSLKRLPDRIKDKGRQAEIILVQSSISYEEMQAVVNRLFGKNARSAINITIVFFQKKSNKIFTFNRR